MLDTILSLKEVLLEGLGATLYMVIGSTLLAYLLGLPLGVLLYTTSKGGIHENQPLNRVLGWIMIGLGVWALYSSIIEPILYNLLSWYFVNMVPTIVVAALLIAGGFWLLGGKRGRSGGYMSPDDIPPYPGGDWNNAGNMGDADIPGFSGMPDENLNNGSAPRWPRAGLHNSAPEQDAPRTDADDETQTH